MIDNEKIYLNYLFLFYRLILDMSEKNCVFCRIVDKTDKQADILHEVCPKNNYSNFKIKIKLFF